MSEPQKLRAAEVEPPLTKLKRLPAEDRAAIFDLRNQPGMTNEAIRARIREVHGIELRRDGQLSEFWQWQYRQMQFDRLNELGEEDEERLAKQYPGVSRDRLRDVTIKRMYALADLEEDPKFALKVVGVDLKESAERRDWEKFRLEQKSKIEAGLDELAEMLKAYPELMEGYRAWRERLTEKLD